MGLIEMSFTDQEIANLKNYRDNQSDGRLKLRFIALLLLSEGFEVKKVAMVIGNPIKTINNWFFQYKHKGIDSLNSFQYQPKKSFLTTEQIEDLAKWVRETYPSKLKKIRSYIQEKFKVTLSLEGIRKIIKKQGLKLLCPKTTPGKAPTEEDQKKVVEDYFAMKASAQPGTVFLFGDGMHLIHQNIPGLCWGDPKNPPILLTNTGRQRLNILGAYNPDSHEFVHLTGEQNCDAKRVIEYLEVILAAYPLAPRIVLFLDNATYFKAKIVRAWLKSHSKMELIFLPPYSPNLNLIERFWRFVKEELVRNVYYEKYKTFRAKTFQLLNHVDEHIDKLKTLMVEKFQIVTTKAYIVPKQT